MIHVLGIVPCSVKPSELTRSLIMRLYGTLASTKAMLVPTSTESMRLRLVSVSSCLMIGL